MVIVVVALVCVLLWFACKWLWAALVWCWDLLTSVVSWCWDLLTSIVSWCWDAFTFLLPWLIAIFVVVCVAGYFMAKSEEKKSRLAKAEEDERKRIAAEKRMRNEVLQLAAIKDPVLRDIALTALKKRISGKHPAVLAGMNYADRVAYFQGLGVASLVDDGEVDDVETYYLQKAGAALSLSDEDIKDLLDAVKEACQSEDGRRELIDDAARAVRGKNMGEVFLCELMMMHAGSSEHDKNREFIKAFAVQLGLALHNNPVWRFQSIVEDGVCGEELVAQCKMVFQERKVLEYFFPDFFSCSEQS